MCYTFLNDIFAINVLGLIKEQLISHMLSKEIETFLCCVIKVTSATTVRTSKLSFAVTNNLQKKGNHIVAKCGDRERTFFFVRGDVEIRKTKYSIINPSCTVVLITVTSKSANSVVCILSRSASVDVLPLLRQ
jgi:hypothetical protein